VADDENKLERYWKHGGSEDPLGYAGGLDQVPRQARPTSGQRRPCAYAPSGTTRSRAYGQEIAGTPLIGGLDSSRVLLTRFSCLGRTRVRLAIRSV
jgi:hypothetical protein